MHERFEINLAEGGCKKRSKYFIQLFHLTLFFSSGRATILSLFSCSLFFHFLHISNTASLLALLQLLDKYLQLFLPYSIKICRMNVLNIWNFSFFEKRLKLATRNSFLLLFFLCSVLKIFILLLKERESNVLLFFLSILSRCWKRKWNPKKKNHPIHVTLHFYFILAK